MKEIGKDLFGNPIFENELLSEKFIIPPFSVLNTGLGDWQRRKEKWKSIGIRSEVGREDGLLFKGAVKDFDHYRVKEGKMKESKSQSTSIFDPVLCEIMYKWFCPAKGKILDPFAGGSVRGIVAGMLGYDYVGIELRKEQIESNIIQAQEIPDCGRPKWMEGDSEKVINDLFCEEYDMVFTCPPYYSLEKYSDDPSDLSNLSVEEFDQKYERILLNSCDRLKKDRFIVIVVGDVRNDHGFYIDLISKTKDILKKKSGLYNELILLNQVASASMRATMCMKNRKVAKIHQNVLIFFKGNPDHIQDIFKEEE